MRKVWWFPSRNDIYRSGAGPLLSALVAEAAARCARGSAAAHNPYTMLVQAFMPNAEVTGYRLQSVKILNSLVNDFLERLAVEAASLARGSKKRTLGSREIQTAVRLTLPAELAKHAMAEGTRAVAKATA